MLRDDNFLCFLCIAVFIKLTKLGVLLYLGLMILVPVKAVFELKDTEIMPIKIHHLNKSRPFSI